MMLRVVSVLAWPLNIVQGFEVDKHGSIDGEVYADSLTWREQDILVLLSERLSNREIAERLHLAESTVKDYVGNILSKLYVKNRREAVERATDLGLLDRDRETAVVSTTNLPPERTPFVGRRGDLTEIRQELGKTRLLTLIGPGGIGKTRLALKVAEGAVDIFKDGVFFVPLAPIRSIKDIIQTIAEALKFPIATHEDPQCQLLRYLRKRQLLLLLDNFEHLLDGAGLASEILQAAPTVKILATSRERLNLQSETVLHISGMAFPDQVGIKDPQDYDAIALFMQSAKRVRPGFDPSQQELGGIINICQVVEGMPLAIELAAAWLHIISVDEIVDELEKDLDILATEVRDAPVRHRSIRAVFDQSWALLNQVEQEIFTGLSVFRGGFTREAAQQVTGASLKLLAALVNKSFLNRDQASGRLEVHELLRQYGQERLDKKPGVSIAAQDAHAVYYAEFMQKRREHLRSDRQMQALAEIGADIENVRAAWRFCLNQRNIAQIWKFIFTLWHVYWIHWWNHAGMELFAEAVKALQGESSEESAPLRAMAMAFQGYFMAFLDLPEQGYELAAEGVEILEKHSCPEALVLAYDSLVVNAYFLSRMSEEVQATNRMLEIATHLEDKWLLAFTLFAAGMVALINGDLPKAKRLAESNLKLYEKFGDAIGATIPLIVLGHEALARGAYEEAKGYYLHCLKTSEQVRYYFSIQTASKYLSKVALSLGDTVEGETYLVQSLRITKEIGFVRDIINLLYEFARLRAAQDDSEGAVELLALVLQHPASNQTRWLEGRIRDSAKSLLARLEAELASEVYMAALERGQALELDEVIADLVSPKTTEDERQETGLAKMGDCGCGTGLVD